MRRIVVVGLSLGAMVGIGATFAAGAQAAEIVSCVKASKISVEYTKKNGKKVTKEIFAGKYGPKCKEAAPEHTGKYPPYEGPEGHFERGAVGSHFTSASAKSRLKPKLEFADGNFVQCAKSGGGGEFLSGKTGIETSTFTECHLVVEEKRGEACTSPGAAAAEVKSSAVPFTVVSYPEELIQYHYGPKNEVESSEPVAYEEGKVFIDFSAGLGTYSEFACGAGASFRILGSVTAAIHAKFNVEHKKMLWDVEPGEGAQDLYAEESTNGGSTWEPIGRVQESYEARAADSSGLEVIEPL